MKSENKYGVFTPSFFIMILFMAMVLVNSSEAIIAQFFDVDIEHMESILEEDSKEKEDIEEDTLDELLLEIDKEHETIENDEEHISYSPPSSTLQKQLNTVTPPPEYMV